MDINQIKNKFKTLFGDNYSVYASPGRINLIGEHTDYNGGFVFPGAIDKSVVACIHLNGTNTVRAYSIDKENLREFRIDQEDLEGEQHWSKYIFGVCREIQKRGYTIGGFDTVFAGDVPIGAGMSSSAALESTYAFALNDLFHLGIDKFELARIGQMTEHNYVGVKCGIMDQFASLFGKKGHLMRLNCATMEFEYFPFDPKGYKLVLLDTIVKHELASSAYNKRRESCENACAHIAKRHPEVKYLSDASMAMLEEVKNEIPEEDYMRAKYVIGEKQRVLDVCDALGKGDYATVGERMYGTHYGMSKEYEVSCDELDFLNDLAKQCGVTGSRVMGGGFGGCTINLVKEGLYDKFIATAKEQFSKKFGYEPKVYDVVISDGARRID
jgi:galactokinase